MAEKMMDQETMDKKKNDLITKYLSDMAGLEEHIYQAIDKQVKATEDQPECNEVLKGIRDTLEVHVNTLNTRLEALGGHPGNPVKQAGSAVLGVAAGVIDKVRAEELSKDLRDDYTALNLSCISYVMLSTTALACNDQETAVLAEQHLRDNAGFVIEIGKTIPAVVVKDLSDFTDLNKDAAQQAREIYASAWEQGGSQQGQSQSWNQNGQMSQTTMTSDGASTNATY